MSEFLTPPPGTFFRVHKADQDGDMYVELRTTRPSRWFNRTREVLLHSEHATEHSIYMVGPKKAVRRVMENLIRRYEESQEENSLVGDYPPKQMPVR